MNLFAEETAQIKRSRVKSAPQFWVRYRNELPKHTFSLPVRHRNIAEISRVHSD